MVSWLILPEGLKAMARGMQPEDFIGHVSLWLSKYDERSATEQLDAGYQHGGGWRPMEGFAMDDNGVLTSKGDPPLRPFAVGILREEMILCYPHALFAVLQNGGDFEVARMD